MTTDSEEADWEPIVAHGARMSWAGLLRPGDEFSPPVRSRVVALESTDPSSLQRSYGGWSTRYHRFTSNLSTPRLRVRVTTDRGAGGHGLQGILHWVRRADVERTGPGSVCHGDGWPEELWNRFLSNLDQLPGTSLAEKLEAFAHSTVQRDVPIVAEWRERLRDRDVSTPASGRLLGEGWIPVPAHLEGADGTAVCIVSWSASPFKFASLREALAAAPSLGKVLDPINQVRYYLECMLARLHGVAFGPSDQLADPWFESSPTVQRLEPEYYKSERARIADPRFGRLDARG